MKSSLFDFPLSEDKIAQHPAEPRDSSKMLCCLASGRLGDLDSVEFSHRKFSDILELLGPNDFLVFNDAKVLPVRLFGKRVEGGGAVEVLLLKKVEEGQWSALLHMSAKVRPGLLIDLGNGLQAEILSTREERLKNEGEVRLKLSGISTPLEVWLSENGHVPLPPYIDREDTKKDKNTYQTVYAEKVGSAAAPTAGFHFTPELLEKLKAKGVETGMVTLHVGLGTFRPIKVDDLSEHKMHEEEYEITPEFLEKFNKAKKEGKRIVAVGTTVIRTLESWMMREAQTTGRFATRAFIQPGFEFKAVDDLITNFHLPKSTLLVLIAAAMGMENMKKAYELALGNDYRFFSYGDAMFIRGGR